MRNTITFIGCLILLASCRKAPISSEYFKSSSRTGLIIVPKLISTVASGSSGGGLIGTVISESLAPKKSKYDSALQILKPAIDPTQKIEQMYQDLYSQKGKALTILHDTINFTDFPKFPPADTSRKYFKKDLRSLKATYDIDYLQISSATYGIYSRYSYGIETDRYGKLYIRTTIINLSDNSIFYRTSSIATSKIDGDWNIPPDYEPLKTSILKAVKVAIALEKQKYETK
jgi:hypothetical protein